MQFVDCVDLVNFRLDMRLNTCLILEKHLTYLCWIQDLFILSNLNKINRMVQ